MKLLDYLKELNVSNAEEDVTLEQLVDIISKDWVYTNREIANVLGVHVNTVGKVGRILFPSYGLGWTKEYTLQQAIMIKEFLDNNNEEHDKKRIQLLEYALKRTTKKEETK